MSCCKITSVCLSFAANCWRCFTNALMTLRHYTFSRQHRTQDVYEFVLWRYVAVQIWRVKELFVLGIASIRAFVVGQQLTIWDVEKLGFRSSVVFRILLHACAPYRYVRFVPANPLFRVLPERLPLVLEHWLRLQHHLDEPVFLLSFFVVLAFFFLHHSNILSTVVTGSVLYVHFQCHAMYPNRSLTSTNVSNI